MDDDRRVVTTTTTTTNPTTAPALSSEEDAASKRNKILVSKQRKWFGSAVTVATNFSSSIPYDPFPEDLRRVIAPHILKATKRRQQALEEHAAILLQQQKQRKDPGSSKKRNDDDNDNNKNNCTDEGQEENRPFLWSNIVDDDENDDENYDESPFRILKNFLRGKYPLSREGHFSFDTQKYPVREAFLTSCGVHDDGILNFDLTQLHLPSKNNNSSIGNNIRKSKWDLLRHLTEHYRYKNNSSSSSSSSSTINNSDSAANNNNDNNIFQQVYDEFVRDVCCPKLYDLWEDDEIYYQSFPCIRMIQPGEFSIGPHADCSYGHHPFSINFYVLLTDVTEQNSSSALFLESQVGKEDWHPILGSFGTMVKHFPGATCLHWTTDNNTNTTRVSLDFRLIPGSLFHLYNDNRNDDDGSGDPTSEEEAVMEGNQQQQQQQQQKHHKLDVFRQTEGYYSCCRLRTKTKNSNDNRSRGSIKEEKNSNSNKEGDDKQQQQRQQQTWERIGPLQTPDARMGFPWTVSDWDKFMRKNRKQTS